MKKVKKIRAMKTEKVKGIADKLSTAKVIGIIDLYTLPNRQLQAVRKRLRGKADVVIAKTTLLRKALSIAGKNNILEYVTAQKALVLSSTDPFILYKEICANPLKVYAKVGQVAPSDIVVPAGETTLPPGPVLSELKAAGIDARVQGGKIAIGKDSTVLKKGAKINDAVAKALQKLDIKPFELSVNVPIIAEGDLVYTRDVLHIDEAAFLGSVASAASNAFALSVEIAYPTQQNIDRLLQKAWRSARMLGLDAGIVTPELAVDLLLKAVRQASALSEKVPESSGSSESPAASESSSS